jgi:hypothetical protein
MINVTALVAERVECGVFRRFGVDFVIGPVPGRRVPKVTVTREGSSLCQKGCYPVAFVLVNCSLSPASYPVCQSPAHSAFPGGGGAEQ